MAGGLTFHDNENQKLPVGRVRRKGGVAPESVREGRGIGGELSKGVFKKTVERVSPGSVIMTA